MGPLLFAGLALFGATIGLGTLATGALRDPAGRPETTPSRRLAIIVAAFGNGAGVLGVVVGVLGTVMELRTDQTAALLVVAFAGVGATIGQLRVIKNADELEVSIVRLLRMFVIALLVLGVVVAILAITIGRTTGPDPDPLPFALVGALSAAGTIGMGVAGSKALRSMAGLKDGPVATQAISRAINRIVPFQALSVIATVIAILLLVQA